MVIVGKGGGRLTSSFCTFSSNFVRSLPVSMSSAFCTVLISAWMRLVFNFHAACSAGLSYGMEPPQIAAGIVDCNSVPGRFERVDAGQPFLVAVDYAHTDDALRNLIAVARAMRR